MSASRTKAKLFFGGREVPIELGDLHFEDAHEEPESNVVRDFSVKLDFTCDLPVWEDLVLSFETCARFDAWMRREGAA